GIVADIRTARTGKSGAVIRNQDTGEETLRTDLSGLPDVHSFLTEVSTRLRKDKDLTPGARRALNILVSALISPSLSLNREATTLRGNAAAESVEPVYHHLQKGEMVVRKGDRVSREQQIKLQAIYNVAGERVRWKSVLGAFGFSLLLAIGLFIAPSGKPGTPLRCKDLFLIALVLLIFSIGAKATYLLAARTSDPVLLSSLAYAFPVAGAVGLVALVFAARRYCTMGLLLAFFCTLMFHGDITLFLFYFLGGMLTTWLVTRAQNRQDVVWSIIPLTIGQTIIWAASAGLAQASLGDIVPQAVAVMTSSVISLLTLFALSPVLELMFGYTTRFRLMELMNLEQPLMQEIMVTMPGTYNHSLVVANMVEAGAKAIGANSLLCKVAALYHDAGKLSHPEYFIENQFGGKNKHDKLAPSMSALILISHVKKGTELAEAHGLGQEILDIIRQHHGTRIIRYFYQKALDMGESPRESDYCYPGPRPQTKEAAILMLADSVEASSRTLSEPTPARIKSHIDTIIKGIFSEGQLDESELTFKDLHKLIENFLRIMTGIFHQRIAYTDY
ncbi:MAG: HDIG domain-containing protein, partial [Desulfovibrionaceae bacterium]|nr:HDIG domain-containing protein [Desulfovibrionaceae bacterium]